MSSINPHFTFTYSQPADYRFSHDSVFLARQVFERHAGDPVESWRVLDLCAGCGIVGMDFVFHCFKELGRAPVLVDAVDVQAVYRPHFERNAFLLAHVPTQFRFVQQNYADLLSAAAAQYDLILCNPPFFEAGRGKLSPSEFKNRCRFFLDSDAPTLIKAARHVLKPGGVGYFLMRDPSLAVGLEAAGEVRGTGLFVLRG